MNGCDKHLHALLQAHPEAALEHAKLFVKLPPSTRRAIMRRRKQLRGRRAMLLSLTLGCGLIGVAEAASISLEQSGRSLSEEPAVSARAIALADHDSTARSPHWIVYLPDFGLTRQPARIAHAYRVDTTRVVLLVQQNVPR